MSKTVKLSQEELQQIKDNQDRITQLTYSIGNVELQKLRLVSELERVQTLQNNLGTELSEKYGEGNINFETGELTLNQEPDPSEETPEPAE